MNRRALVQGALLTGGLASVMATPQVSNQPSTSHSELNLDDPLLRTKVLAKIKGSIATETVYTFCRLHLYLWLNGGNLLPMLTMQNLAAASWRPLPNGHYAAVLREVGVYTEFDRDDIVDTWLNPVTGERRDVWQFASGPLDLLFCCADHGRP